MVGQSTFPAAFSSLLRRRIISPDLRPNAASADVQIEAIPDSTAAKWTRQTSKTLR
jgi:hypothetical protein